MPWRNGPDFWDLVIGMAALLLATFAGAVAKIADDVKNGSRRRFWSKQLWLDFPAVAMMAFLAWGVTEYFEFAPGVGAGIGAVFGWLGPRTVDVFAGYKLRQWEKKHDRRF